MTTHDLAIPPLVPPGTVLGGRFEVGEVLGTGGSATVFAGRDTRLGRPVAVKVLRPDLAADAGAQAAFQVEATAAAMLSHPGIVTVHDVGADEVGDRTIAWIAMERVRGRTVRSLLASGAVPPLDPVDALDLTAHVLAALDHAHQRGVVHRDISPGNVMITDDGAVKVLDFGIAAIGEQRTESDVVHGSVAYVSPEQAQGVPVDRRSDLYSVGCLLFALVTGAPPYLADEVRDVALMHVTALVPRASSRLPGVPAEVDALLVRLLAKRPGDRPATAGALRDEVLRVAAGLRAAGPDHSTTTVIPRVSTTTAFAPVRRPAGPATVPVPVARELAERRRQEPVCIVHARPLVAPRPPEPGRRSVLWPVTLLVMTTTGLAALLLWLFFRPDPVVPASVTVPDVAGQTTEAARQALDTAGMRDGSVRTEAHDTVPAGLVVRTDPAAGESVAAESPVLIVVSGGPQARPSVSVPQLDGATLTEARAMIERAGLVLGELTREDSARPADTVLASDPGVGTTLEPGAVVALTLASGNQVVPDVTGLGIGIARAQVQDAGFGVEVLPAEDDRPPGTVLGVQPAAGTSLRLGSTVTLVVAVGPSPTDDPSGPASPSSTSTPDPSGTPSSTPTGPSLGEPTDRPTDPSGGGER
ncbi:Stk1 family PASTA domain-containing Ser/Thr kinase [Jiangella ureilytica]|uniref:non-specific serine/threonine protein kinase n=1 Tax=Jiangella ureilytica TaxID=2530374 RepID=A0A4R4RIR4_9ACTN|nr:Stk1 family PASTA domain-containing Ser/Thr kinase [Jiangella ureilytica]TDC48353.1 Stk1 family PASTA domain-containing Ser/Thr kinase [Jiangella ureilytica]